jgi:hypothetical protein
VRAHRNGDAPRDNMRAFQIAGRDGLTRLGYGSRTAAHLFDSRSEAEGIVGAFVGGRPSEHMIIWLRRSLNRPAPTMIDACLLLGRLRLRKLPAERIELSEDLLIDEAFARRAIPVHVVAPATQHGSLRAFLMTPHPSMPNYRLAPQEIDDVVTYILSLRRRG